MLPLIVKSFHIVALVSWFAMLFYLPRLFVYHSMTEDTAGRERFKVMERKLYRAIGTPAMIATILFGAWTAYFFWSYYSISTWFWIKVALVIGLVGYHHMCGAYVKKFAQDLPVPSHKFFRVFNEIPVLFLIAIVLLVVIKKPT